MDQTIIDKAKQENPGADLRRVSNDEFGIEVLVKTPTSGEWKAFRAAQADDDKDAIRNFVLLHVVAPTPREFAGTLEKLPGLAEQLGKELVKLAGATIKLSVEKV